MIYLGIKKWLWCKTKSKMRKIFYFISLGVFLILFWFFGGAPDMPDYHEEKVAYAISPDSAEKLLQYRESLQPVKLANEARIVWADDSLHQKTEYVVLYLHGFGASSEEGNPVHQQFAKKYHANLLLTRLYGHGLTDSLPMQNFTVQKYWDSAVDYLSMAKALGDKVIVMGTSTGGSLALLMASLFDEVEAVILLSPNIRINSSRAWVLNNHWGREIARLSTGSDQMISDNPASWYDLYWYRRYSMQGVVEMQQLLETAMVPEVFKAVKQPVLLLYYYKDADHQDEVVSVPAMLKMFSQLGTPDSLKMKKALPDAGDHAIGCHLRSGDVEGVMEAMVLFGDSLLGKPIMKL